MSGLTWRDNETGRETRCPWPVPGNPVLPAAPLVLMTPAGKAVIFTETFEDESAIIAMTFPGGAYFMRISPETDWALEEKREGAPPAEIAEKLDDSWRTLIDSFAARNKELREQREASPQHQGEEKR